MRNPSIIIGLVLAVFALTAKAVDLGVWGSLYPIDEPDIRKVLISQASEVDWAEKNRELERNSEKWFDELPSFGLGLASETKTEWVDPSIVLTDDIYMPIQDEKGDWNWELVYPAGTIVNPLDKVRPNTNMLFIDADDREQREFAINALKAYPYRLMIVLVDGNPRKLAKGVRMPIYYANQSMIDRFRIKRVPSLLGVGDGEKSRFLAVTQFAKPYSLQILASAWHGLDESNKLGGSYK